MIVVVFSTPIKAAGSTRRASRRGRFCTEGASCTCLPSLRSHSPSHHSTERTGISGYAVMQYQLVTQDDLAVRCEQRGRTPRCFSAILRTRRDRSDYSGHLLWRSSSQCSPLQAIAVSVRVTNPRRPWFSVDSRDVLFGRVLREAATNWPIMCPMALNEVSPSVNLKFVKVKPSLGLNHTWRMSGEA